jgi:hypothetical protein
VREELHVEGLHQAPHRAGPPQEPELRLRALRTGAEQTFFFFFNGSPPLQAMHVRKG